MDQKTTDILAKFLNDTSSNTIDLGHKSSLERKYLHDWAIQNKCFSMTDKKDKGDVVLIISKSPFEDKSSDYAIIREFKYLTSTGAPTNVDTIDKFKNFLKGDNLYDTFIDFLSFIESKYDNNIVTYQKDKSDVIDRTIKALKSINPRIVDYGHEENDIIKQIPKSTILDSKNHGKKIISLDLRSASSTIFGIRDWYRFIGMITDIEFFKNSKNLKRKIIYEFCSIEIHDKAIKQIKLDIIYKLLEYISVDDIISIQNDNICIEMKDNIDYHHIFNLVDPISFFRYEKFTLIQMKYKWTTFFVEYYMDGSYKTKCVDPRLKKEIHEFIKSQTK